MNEKNRGMLSLQNDSDRNYIFDDENDGKEYIYVTSSFSLFCEIK